PGAYIAPDLLPGRDAPDIAAALNLAWPQDAIAASAGTTVTRRYALLSDTLLRALMVGIGKEAGLSAIYWNRGVAAREATTGARLLVERGDLTAADGSTDSTDDWAGTLTLRTLDGDAPALLAQMLTRLDELEKHYGVMHKAQTPVTLPEARGGEAEEAARKPDFSRERNRDHIKREGVFVSYSHGVGEEYVNKLCAAAFKRGIHINRDTREMKDGDFISEFSDRLALGERVIFFMSPKFIKSFYCVYELTSFWERCESDCRLFRTRGRFFRIPIKTKRRLEPVHKNVESLESLMIQCP
ncbi:MAG: toll/interleukin-1 receptor domain-containing protein, partial [Pseudomonadota bacterium]